MRYVHYDEFNDDGMSSCPGGKYFQTIQLDSDYRNVDCTAAVEAFPELLVKKDLLVSQLWEFISPDTKGLMYGCLNPACKKALGQTFSSSFYLLIGYCFKFSTVSIVSIGLAAHVNRFNNHF